MDKLSQLKSILRGYGKVAVAYSGGVDSTFLLKVAHDELGDKVIAITSRSLLNLESDFLASKKWAEEESVSQLVVRANELEFPGFAQNPPDRCYICKKALFAEVKKIAQDALPDSVVVDGSNVDDQSDYRPGTKALKELEVKSPLLEAGLTKAEIRAFSRELGLPTWDKPSAACLASRFPYGDTITAEGLERVAAAEEVLHRAGFDYVRVRVHGQIARIEVPPEQIVDFARRREEVVSKLRALGFAYVALDLEGYRTGSLNELL